MLVVDAGVEFVEHFVVVQGLAVVGVIVVVVLGVVVVFGRRGFITVVGGVTVGVTVSGACCVAVTSCARRVGSLVIVAIAGCLDVATWVVAFMELVGPAVSQGGAVGASVAVARAIHDVGLVGSVGRVHEFAFWDLLSRVSSYRASGAACCASTSTKSRSMCSSVGCSVGVSTTEGSMILGIGTLARLCAVLRASKAASGRLGSCVSSSVACTGIRCSRLVGAWHGGGLSMLTMVAVTIVGLQGVLDLVHHSRHSEYGKNGRIIGFEEGLVGLVGLVE